MIVGTSIRTGVESIPDNPLPSRFFSIAIPRSLLETEQCPTLIVTLVRSK